MTQWPATTSILVRWGANSFASAYTAGARNESFVGTMSCTGTSVVEAPKPNLFAR